METVGVLSILEGAVLDEVRGLWNLFETRCQSTGVQTFDYPNVTFQGGRCANGSALVAALEALVQRIQPFKIEMDGFGYFETARAVYLRVVPDESLRQIHRMVNELLSQKCLEAFDDYLPERWIPHVTLAMGDLTPVNFERAKHDLSAQQAHYQQTLSNRGVVIIPNVPL